MPQLDAVRQWVEKAAVDWPDGGWKQDLLSVQQELTQLNRDAEASFLAIGDELTGFLPEFQKVHDQAVAQQELMGGAAMEKTGQALAETRAYLDRVAHTLKENHQGFAEVRLATLRIQQTFTELRRIALGFQIAALMARIETAALGLVNNSLSNLNEEVQNCSRSIEERAEQMLELAATLTLRIDQGLGQAIQMAKRQEKDLAPLLSTIDADLAQLRQRQAAEQEQVGALAAAMMGARAELQSILVSMQSQDITRQQLEHIIEALAGVSESARWGRLAPEAGSLLKVQKAQLEATGELFARSTGSLGQGLDALATRVQQTSEQAAAGGREPSGKFLSAMERRLDGLVAAVREIQATDRAAGQVLAELGGMNEQLNASLNGIQAIEVEVHRIAINVALCACQIGEAADPLGVVANSLRLLQEDCSGLSARAGADLAAMHRAMEGLVARMSGAEQQAGDGLAVVNRLQQQVNQIRVNSTSAAAGVAGIQALALGIGAQLRQAHGRIAVDLAAIERAGVRLDSAIGQVRQPWFFARMGGRRQGFGSNGAANSTHNPAANSAANYTPNYTMESERAIHAAVLAGQAVPAPPPETPAGQPANGGGGGDNVEFF